MNKDNELHELHEFWLRAEMNSSNSLFKKKIR